MCSRMACLTTALVLALSISLAAQTSPVATSPTTSQSAHSQIKTVPAPYADPASGKDMYIAYCASCHGKDGMGHGPAAAALKMQPTDLTILAVKNGGKFPESHIAGMIKGTASQPHMAAKKCRSGAPYSLRWAAMNRRKSRYGYTT